MTPAKPDYNFGELSFSEWRGLWKSCRTDSDVDEEEYENRCSALDLYFRTRFAHKPIYPKEFYLRGDFITGDRTQLLEVNNPLILTVEFLESIRRVFAEGQLPPDWRILVPTYLSDEEVIIIYPNRMRISSKYENALPEGIQTIASRMKSYYP